MVAAEIDLVLPELRAIVAYSIGNAEKVVAIFDCARASDLRPREAIAAARAFAGGGKRVKALRDTAWGAHKAAQEVDDPAASAAAQAAMCAPAAAFLHPLAHSAQVRHILGGAAYAARAAELAAMNDTAAGHEFIERAACEASAAVVAVLSRYPAAPAGGGRTGQLLRMLDQKLRGDTATKLAP